MPEEMTMFPVLHAHSIFHKRKTKFIIARWKRIKNLIEQDAAPSELFSCLPLFYKHYAPLVLLKILIPDKREEMLPLWKQIKQKNGE